MSTESDYLDHLFALASERRYSTAIEIWATVLQAVINRRTYNCEANEEVVGITAKDIANQLGMGLSSVYHNLKILQSEEFHLLETVEICETSSSGRKITQNVYRIPDTYIEQYERLILGSPKKKYDRLHKSMVFFNTLKLQGFLAPYANLLHKDKVLVDKNNEIIEDWYSEWFKQIAIEEETIQPGVIYSLKPEDVKEVLEFIEKKLKEKAESSKEIDRVKWRSAMFTYLVFPPYTEEMRKGEWIDIQKYKERMEKIEEQKDQEEKIDCEKDHETFFKYGVECPVCGKKAEKNEK